MLFLVTALVLAAAAPAVTAQVPKLPGSKEPPSKNPTPASTTTGAGQAGAQGGDSKSSSATDAKLSASGKTTTLSPLDPSSAPVRAFSRPRIGLAMGGGGAIALSEVGVLQWFEENRIPVDVIAGTSMGCMVSALYSTGRKPESLKRVVNDRVFTSVFSFSNAYKSRSFRRREETRDLPNAITIGFKHHVSFRNAVLVDQGLNAFLDREFLRYDDQTDFNTLPIPLRCISTDLNEARPVTFARGSIPDAVRASVSLPGVFPPFEMKGHEYVDGGVLENLPTSAVHDMQADVVLAVSMPLTPVAQGELSSLLGVLGRSFSVAIEATEREERKHADVVIIPDITGFGAADYLKSVDLADRGYKAAEAHRAELLKYALPEADWDAYLAHRTSLMHGPAGPVLRVRVTAPDPLATLAIQHLFAPLVNQPVDTAKIEALLDQVRADGGYDADYTVGYETPQQFAAQAAGQAQVPSDAVPVAAATTPEEAARTRPVPDKFGPTENKKPGAPIPKLSNNPSSNQPGVPKSGGEPPANPTANPAANPAADSSVVARPGAPGLAATKEVSAESLSDIAARPILLVTVSRKKTGPPFLYVGANIAAVVPAFTRATVEGSLVDQNFLSYGSELRSDVKLGYLTFLATEYFHPLNPLAGPKRTVFVAPRMQLLRQPFPIYANQKRIADRQLQTFDLGADVGWTNQRSAELRAGYDFSTVRWQTLTGADGAANYSGLSQKLRARYIFDTQDRGLVPQFGIRLSGEAGILFSGLNAENAPQFQGRVAYAHRFSLHRAPPKGTPVDPNRGHEILVFSAEAGTMFKRNVAEPFRFTLGGPLRLSASAIDQYRGTDYFLIEPGILRRIANLPQPLGQSIYLGFGFEAAQISAPGLPVIHRQDAYFGVVAETPLGVITFAPAIGTNGERKFVFTLGKLF